MYRERMNSYYPKVIQSIVDFQAILDGEAPEIELANEVEKNVIADAYLTTMGENRIREWEEAFGITPLEDSSVDDRRETVIARIRGQGKLNTALINLIVSTFTGGTATSWIEDSVLNIVVDPPPEYKEYKFPSLEQEIIRKIPAHLGYSIRRYTSIWEELNNSNTDWLDVKIKYKDWNDVFMASNSRLGKLDVTKLDKFVLDRG